MADRGEPRDTSISDASRRAPEREHVEGPRQGTSVESGISNRPIADEQAEQQNLPPRGSSEDGTHA